MDERISAALSKLYKIAAQIAQRKGLPDPSSWPGWTARTPQKLWRAARSDTERACAQCGEWAYDLGTLAKDFSELRKELAHLRAENVAQLAELHAISDALGTNEGPSSVDHILALRAENAALIAQLDDTHARMNALRADAERYRWLRSERQLPADWFFTLPWGEDLDAGIDAAQKEEQ